VSESAIAEWEGQLVTLEVLASPSVDSPGGEPVDPLPIPGTLERVGSDGIVFQRADSPDQTEGSHPATFYPWHTVRLVRKAEQQDDS
jgi:hypothetical protein